jgi:hypothetical protein
VRASMPEAEVVELGLIISTIHLHSGLNLWWQRCVGLGAENNDECRRLWCGARFVCYCLREGQPGGWLGIIITAWCWQRCAGPRFGGRMSCST